MITNNLFLGHWLWHITIGSNPSAEVIFSNNIFTGAEEQVLWHSNGVHNSHVELSYNCFWNNARLIGPDENGWPGYGQLNQVNRNGDSCDAYFNILLDPIFVDSSGHISNISPCIDAGIDIGLPFFGEAPDIGRWELEVLSAGILNDAVANESKEQLRIFPNPSSSIVAVEFFASDYQRIFAYNILGQMVQKIENIPKNGSAILDFTNLPSGQYLLQFDKPSQQSLRLISIIK